jgi:hypothetical protein
MLLRQPWRNAKGIKQLRQRAKELGIKPTAEGLTTVSAEITKDAFETIFKTPIQEAPARPPGDKDFGRSGGHVSGDLPIPKPLEEYVESITVASPYLRM